MEALRLVTVLSAIILLQNAPDVGAISGGKMANPGQFPHQVLIQPYGGSDFCSGALIDAHWVLTAASCIKDSILEQITLGAFDLSETFEDTRQSSFATSMVVHDGYNANTKENDIALIKLDIEAQLIDSVAPVRLPAKKDAHNKFVLENGSVSGWGATGNDDTTVEKSALQWFESRVEPNSWCSKRNGAQTVHDSTICLSSIGKKGICKGDSGSPVVISELDGKATLVGIATDDVTSCGTNKPSVFTRVTSHLDWISNVTGIKLRE